ncbi:sensor histidine kinase [Peribacillus acanthi]|uniref:sensor histidine kinase n=1 Tax=Peribacillus acanthi TaxID=2171554 RepID=UPI000D3EBC26|nr:HAMP domain-containing sensor histidine kinase [Peribacillus acanthi]
MNIFKLNLATKIWITVATTVIVSLVFAYLLSQYFYEKLYVAHVKENLLTQAELLASDYKGGPLSEEFKEKTEWYNTKNSAEIFVVNNPRELSACLPFDIDYKTLISEEERQNLLNGKAIEKQGYEERFDRTILAVIYPLLDGDRLEGIIYLYLPLASIAELMNDFTTFWLISAFLFIIVFLFIGTHWINRLIKPLKEMKNAAYLVSKGDFNTRVETQGNDEIGSLAIAFNQMSEAIQREDERKREFLADISHELRTPLSYIKGYTQALIDGIVKTPEDERKYLNLVAKETLHLQQLVQDLLDLSKLESKQFEMEAQPIALAQFIEELLEKYQVKLLEKRIQLKVELDPEPIIYGDELRLEQVLQNVIENSIRYTSENGTITVCLTGMKNQCQIMIEDTGIGIAKEHLSKLTERFYRVNKARSRNDGGSGLGLSIVKKLMDMHRGNIHIESIVNKGTKVFLQFPTINEE